MAGALSYSSTYQKLWREGFAEGFAQGFAEGRVEGAREMLMRLGRKRFGVPPTAIRVTLERLNDTAQLVDLVERVVEVSSWDDLGLDRATR